ncbi:hypothetical protein VTN31DRAFT_4179 [Thermomyces dupontii]|uniref:uncharacterized protein n=1 Tax=Talaromyces thermophilus TaxID=28565 RepID=UPI0037437229
MTDLTPIWQNILQEKHSIQLPTRPSLRERLAETGEEEPTRKVNEFLKEAYRINTHITSLLEYLHSIRHSYLSITTKPRTGAAAKASARRTETKPLSDADRDTVDSSTALVLRDLSNSINNLSSAEALRQETEARLLEKKYPRKTGIWRWAAGGKSGTETGDEAKSEEQVRDEETARTIRAVRESILWLLRRRLEHVTELQREMVEKRIERVREREKSALYKQSATTTTPGTGPTPMEGVEDSRYVASTSVPAPTHAQGDLSAADESQIEQQLSPEQLQLFEEENSLLLRSYEDTLNKIQNAEKSLLEISSLQNTLVSHLATQDEYISQLVADASNTASNVQRGNAELKRATERRSTAQMVFWGTVGLCTSLIIWDAIF